MTRLWPSRGIAFAEASHNMCWPRIVPWLPVKVIQYNRFFFFWGRELAGSGKGHREMSKKSKNQRCLWPTAWRTEYHRKDRQVTLWSSLATVTKTLHDIPLCLLVPVQLDPPQTRQSARTGTTGCTAIDHLPCEDDVTVQRPLSVTTGS